MPDKPKRPYSVMDAAVCYCRPPDCDCTDARVQAAELTATFNLRWEADMRAIKRWRAATGRDLVWPDHADLVVWLAEQLDAALAAPAPDPALREALATIEAMQSDAADLTDLIGEAAAMRTVLGHLLNDRGRIHDSGCGVCDAGRALLISDHELPSFRSALDAPAPAIDRERLARAINRTLWGGISLPDNARSDADAIADAYEADR